MLLSSLLIETRRFFFLLFMPWVSVLIFCSLASWYSFYFLDLDVLLAPVLKAWLLLKPFLVKTLPALLLWLWVNTWGKLVGWLSELIVLLSGLLGGWKAWSVKKLLRQMGRFFLSLSARFLALSVVINLLHAHERRGVKLLPRFAMSKLHSTRVGVVLRWWADSSDRKKRLLLGTALCLVLVAAGQTILGISVLLFDLVWELLLLVWRMLILLWRVLSPYLLKLVPNFVGNFITGKLLPYMAEIIPIVRDDHRVMYLRLNLRRQYRRVKAWLYLRSRERRVPVRQKITPLVADKLRDRKSALLDAAAKLRESEKETGKRFLFAVCACLAGSELRANRMLLTLAIISRRKSALQKPVRKNPGRLYVKTNTFGAITYRLKYRSCKRTGGSIDHQYRR